MKQVHKYLVSSVIFEVEYFLLIGIWIYPLSYYIPINIRKTVFECSSLNRKQYLFIRYITSENVYSQIQVLPKVVIICLANNQKHICRNIIYLKLE